MFSFQESLGVSRDLIRKSIGDCSHQPKPCSQLGLQGQVSRKQSWGVLQDPLYTMPEWAAKFPDIPILLNTSFFEVEFLNGWPHEMPCTNIFGVLKSSDGYFIGHYSEDYPLDYFVINKNGASSRIEFVPFEEFTHAKGARAFAIANGFIIVRNGKFVFRTKKPVNNPDFKNRGYCNKRNGRMMVGLLKDDLYLFNVDNREKDTYAATCKELADIAVNKFGVTDLFAFDSGGSATIFVRDAANSDKFLYQTPSSDTQGYRPIPSFIGISPGSMSDFKKL
jgi:hypothetical protein